MEHTVTKDIIPFKRELLEIGDIIIWRNLYFAGSKFEEHRWRDALKVNDIDKEEYFVRGPRMLKKSRVHYIGDLEAPITCYNIKQMSIMKGYKWYDRVRMSFKRILFNLGIKI